MQPLFSCNGHFDRKSRNIYLVGSLPKEAQTAARNIYNNGDTSTAMACPCCGNSTLYFKKVAENTYEIPERCPEFV